MDINVLTSYEYEDLGFGYIDANDFDALYSRAMVELNIYTRYFYERVDFDKDIAFRKKAFKLALCYQIGYMNASGILTAEDKHNFSSVQIGQTSIGYSSTSGHSATKSNLSLDALNVLNSAGFGYMGCCYDR